jgi:hypothetical protein
MRARLGLALLAALASLGGVARATSLRIWSYDPANAETRHTAGALTFEFRKQLMFTTVLRVLATEGEAKADVIPVDEKVLGRGGLTALIGSRAPERDLYQIEPEDEGPAMIAALCPKSRRAWLAFGRMRANHDLRIQVLGDDGAGHGAHLCATLNYTFHGEWKLPNDARFDTRLVAQPQFPK